MSGHPHSHSHPHQGADEANGASSSSGAARAAALTSPLALRQLVLNYLVHNCYTDTALAFANDGVVSDAIPQHAAGPSAMATASSSSNGRSSATTTNGSGGSSSTKGIGNSNAINPRSVAATYSSSSAHPLSAPPLSRDDSSMEVEVDQMLSGGVGGAADEGAKEREEADAAARQLGDDEERDTPMEGAELAANGKGKASNSAAALEPSSELSSEEIANARLRKEIRDHILTGRIRQAIDLCNANFPAVLNVDVAAASLSSQGKGGAKGTKASAPGAAGNGSSGSIPRRLPSNPTSLDPQHLFLNLQIQAFIETVRSAATGGASSAPHSSGGHLGSSSSGVGGPVAAHNTPGIAAAHPSISRAASPAPSSTSSTGSAASTSASMASGGGGGSGALNPAIYHALAHAQRLYTLAQSLNPPKWRALYLKELESVTALLAYTDVETSPISKYLDQSRRVALAEQLNSAIMYRTGHAPQPLIESAVRQTSFVWTQLAADKIAVPITPSAAVAAAGSSSGGAGAAALLGLGDGTDIEAYGNVPAAAGRGFNEWIDALEAYEAGLAANGGASTSGDTASSKKARTKVLPPFELARFLGGER